MLNYGKFFRLNNEKTNLGKGISVFDYIWLRDNESKSGSSEFPVYVTINKDSIDFHAHYHEDYTEKGKHIHKHLHNTILSLPLSANLDVKDGLTGALVEGYKTNFPRYDNDVSNYLWQLHWKTFWKIAQEQESDITYCKLNAFVVLEGKEKKELTWKQIIDKIQNVRNEIDYINKPEEEKKNKTEKDFFIEKIKNDDINWNIKRFIRKLILDFIFDLEQTKVFQTSPHYEHISVKLKENYFFSALAAKANFYYWREIIDEKAKEKTIIQKLDKIKKEILSLYPYDGHNYTSQAIEEKLEDKKKVEKEKEKVEKESIVYLEYYLKSAIEWRKHIRNPQSEQAFCGWQKEGWFKDPVREMRNVYKNAKIDILEPNDILQHTYENEIKKSKKWSVANYDFCFKGCHWVWLPRIFISIVGAWLTFILGTALWGNAASKDSQSIYDFCCQLTDKCSYGINPLALGFCLALIFGTYGWLWHNGRRTKIRKKESNRYVLASIYMTALGFVYSVGIGYVLTLFSFSHPWEEGAVKVKHFWSCTPFHESYYWVGVCLSLFISLVIQSFMDNKSPADEL